MNTAQHSFMCSQYPCCLMSMAAFPYVHSLLRYANPRMFSSCSEHIETRLVMIISIWVCVAAIFGVT